MNLNKMKKEQRKKEKEERKKRILDLIATGLSRKEVCTRLGMEVHTFDFWLKEDQMFGHHFRKIWRGYAVPSKAGKQHGDTG